jgi:signal transduction histidine kinase
MYTIGKLKNRLIVLLLSFILILVISVIDYITRVELTMSIFYLIPIVLHALYKGTNKLMVIINSFFAALVWATVVYQANFYSSNFYFIWNSCIVLAFFLLTGLLVFSSEKKNTQIKEMNTHLIQINEEKNKFIGIAAHDIRSHISSINSFSDLLLSDYSKHLTGDLNIIINIIKDTSDSTLELLTNLLNISAIESGRVILKPTFHDYIDFIKRNIFLIQIIADKKNIRITLETNESEIQLNYDEHYLSEVINNLLSNAIKFSNQNSEVTVKVSMTDRNSVLTEIIDRGKGIADDEQIKLFNYFQLTSTTPTAGEKSTGLGLAIAKKIVLEHGGKIGVNSTIGIGSNFYYELFRQI